MGVGLKLRPWLRLHLRNLRYWLIRILFTESERYLMIRAIGYMLETVQTVSVTEKWADGDACRSDIDDYELLRGVFTSKDWG